MCPYFKELLVVVDIAGFIYPSSPKFKKKKRDFYFSICPVQAYQSLAHED